MTNYKKIVAPIILLSIIILSSSAFYKKNPDNTFSKIENKNSNNCSLIIVDTIIKEQLFKMCYDSLKKKVNVIYKNNQVDFTPMEFFNAKSTIDNEYDLLIKRGSKYHKSKLVVINDNKILLSLIDEFLSSGLYIISEIDGKLKVDKINLDDKNISSTELAYVDASNNNVILVDKLSQDGKKSVVKVYDLSGDKPKIIKQKIIIWSKFRGQIKKSNDGNYDAMNYYKIVDKVVKH
ncbi:hypothetical protein ACHRV1_05170 [Flavobacterium aquidurense]|uniref:hypothetical protein n=1 Tax=Flavobacterium aquidurense TaxID=362413 RepID=UPI003757EB3B